VHIQLAGPRSSPPPQDRGGAGLVPSSYGDNDDGDNGTGGGSSDSEGELELDEGAEALAKLARGACADARARLPRDAPLKPYGPGGGLAAAAAAAAPDGESGSARQKPRRRNWAHVSLAKPFALRKHEIEPLLAALTAAVGRVPCFDVEVGPAWGLLPCDPSMTSGGGGSSAGPSPLGARCFVALDVAGGREGLERLVKAVDGSLARFGRPPYFAPPRLHVTVAEVAADVGAPGLAPARAAASFVAAPAASGGGGRSGGSSGGGSSKPLGHSRPAETTDEFAFFRVSDIELKAGSSRYSVKLAPRGY
jgi:hypothetical protein